MGPVKSLSALLRSCDLLNKTDDIIFIYKYVVVIFVTLTSSERTEGIKNLFKKVSNSFGEARDEKNLILGVWGTGWKSCSSLDRL